MKSKNKEAQISTDKSSYWRFIVELKQLPDWLVCFASCLIGYFFITHLYPYPATYSDSFSYVAAAADNQFSIFRPFGYSAFLRFLHPISKSISFVVLSQFLIYFISVALLVMALKKYYPMKAIIRIPVEIILVISPAVIYMLNALMSDALFCCSIFVMIAMLLVMFHESLGTAIAAAIVYLIAFHCSLYLRYSAMFFPFAIVPFLFFAKPKALSWTTIALTGIIFLTFHQNISSNMEKIVHIRQFSTGFDGWQLANNGLNAAPFLDKNEKPSNKKLVKLHQFCMDEKFDSLITAKTHHDSLVTASFLWDTQLPLKQFLFSYMQEKKLSYPVAWAKLGGGLYAEYGKWLIIHHPVEFWKHYLSKNIVAGFYPTHLEIIGKYTEIPMGDKDIVRWFDVKEDQPLAANSSFYEVKLSKVLPLFELIDWIIFIIGVVLLCVFRKSALNSRAKVLSFGLIVAFGFMYYGTTIFASPIALRYWMPMHAFKIAILWMALSELFQQQQVKKA